MIFAGYLFAFLYALVVLAVGAFAFRFGLDRKYSRKIIHILIGFEWFILSATQGASVHFVFVCLLFLLFLVVVYHKNWLPMMSSGEDNAKGTVFFAVSMTIMAIISVFKSSFLPFFGIGVLATSLGDGSGGIVGQAVKQKIRLYQNKTPLGTLFVFLATFFSVFLFSRAYALSLSLWEVLSISILCAGVELLSTRGLDNIFVPLSTSLFSYLLYENIVDRMMFTVALIPFFVALTLSRKKLTLGGAMCAILLALIVAFAFNDRGFFLLVCFFLLALCSDEVKKLVDPQRKRGECRTAWQVLVISIFAMLSSLSYLIFPHKTFLLIYVLTLAEALGDTVCSGFGALAQRTYDPFRRREVEKGESGGISLIGTLAGLFFSLTFIFLSGLLFSIDLSLILLLFICSVTGIFVDSALGSLVQLRYRCPKCNKVVETQKHCGVISEYHSGVRPFDNSFVNLISTVISILLFVLIFYIKSI